jgi:putative two-component system response regulator
MTTAQLDSSDSAGVLTGTERTGENLPGPSESPFPDKRPPRILLVDDEPINLQVARKYLMSAGYREFYFATHPSDVLPLVIREEPDVILLDVVMPKFNGLDLLAAIRSDSRRAHIPVLMLTALEDRETKVKALELGATDFLSKPVDPSELIPRVRNALLIKAHHDHLLSHTANLERLVKERTAQLQASHQNIIHCLARAAEFRDDDTGRHVLRVGRYAGIIARRLGWDAGDVETIEQAAQLHDVGKIGIPDAILGKPGKLTSQEFETIQKHCGFGKRVFESLTEPEWTAYRRHTELGDRILAGCESSVLHMAARIALTHHERWDGAGYPIGLKGEDIPLEGRITAVADVFDALSTRRIYKPAFPLEKCFAILEDGRGSHFDPQVLDAFFAVREQIVTIQIRYADVA